MTLHVVTFEPVRLMLPADGIDGPEIHCSFETRWCANRVSLAGGLDAHHEWPKSLGGPEDSGDVQHLLNLCPTHHRRQHSLIRAMVESGTTHIKTVRIFSDIEIHTASYAVANWVQAGKPAIGGWPSNAAALRRVA